MRRVKRGTEDEGEIVYREDRGARKVERYEKGEASERNRGWGHGGAEGEGYRAKILPTLPANCRHN